MFGERIRQLRRERGMTQSDLANVADVSLRSIQNYESNKLLPRDGRIYMRIAEFFGVSTDYLLGQSDDPHGKSSFETTSDQEVRLILENVGSLFAGGELSERDKDEVMRTITELYWQAKAEHQTSDVPDRL